MTRVKGVASPSSQLTDQERIQSRTCLALTQMVGLL